MKKQRLTRHYFARKIIFLEEAGGYLFGLDFFYLFDQAKRLMLKRLNIDKYNN
jgi:hypothetical protein